MSAKQDKTYTRTAADLERKHNFGKTFAEMLGLINDARDKVDAVESTIKHDILEQVTSITRDSEKIVMEAMEKRTAEQYDELNGKLAAVQKSVKAELTADEVRVEISKAIEGIGSVTTTSGTFDENGLVIKKSDSEIENRIADTGMYVDHGEENVLTADADGVQAINLKSKQFLIVGDNSRLENFETKRTACFYIGG